ncbi:hypothetical protein I7I53_01855 [Histoplasma capsulatum var. duboisii H88]|uniref:Secreted protein n=1 Tax=Ajellomyces capsulatus (strain H88) TaxID=544711 RepID=A0A8A1LLJ8_AJEC8|nr:hypothetical protein I7I53_01855 [Histoplasma capsulatum var. duboisii H88]
MPAHWTRIRMSCSLSHLFALEPGASAHPGSVCARPGGFILGFLCMYRIVTYSRSVCRCGFFNYPATTECTIAEIVTTTIRRRKRRRSRSRRKRMRMRATKAENCEPFNRTRHNKG